MGDLSFISGIGSALFADYAWRKIPGTDAYFQKLKAATSLAAGDPDKSPLAFVEHHHVGEAFLLFSGRSKKYEPYMNGIGAGLILSEALQENPFGVGKSEAEVTGNVFLTALLTGLLLVKFAMK